MTNIICGVDVSSEWLDARVGRSGAAARFANDAAGIEALAAFCRSHSVDLAVLEATGGFERRPFMGLWVQHVPAAIANPRSVRRFAEAMGLLEKTDRLDAGIIAWYAETKRFEPQQPASATQRHLAALVTRLRQLTELEVAQKNQRRLVDDPSVLESFEMVLGTVKRETRRIEAEIAEAIDADPLWQKLDETFRTIKGVADRTVARLMAELPEIGTLSAKAISKLAGLAPLAQDSGKRTGNRSIRGGRAGVRSILFVVAELVRRGNADFADFHARLSAAGKPKKLIRVALAHKLLIRLNAKARDARAEFAIAT